MPIEIKEISEEGEFMGYASVFGNTDFYNDAVEKGAFSKSIKRNSIKMLFNHDPSKIVGVWNTLEEDEKGLKVEGRLLKSIQAGAEMIELIKAKAINSLSIGYRTIRAKFDDKTQIRSLLEVDLQEISLVTFPANDKAKITKFKSKTELEQILRNAGVPNNFAKSIVRCGYEAAQEDIKQRQRDFTDVVDMFK